MTDAEKAREEQESANVKLYGRVFRKCLEEAGAVNKDWPEERVYETAKILFDRFWQDQAAAVRKPSAEPVGAAG